MKADFYSRFFVRIIIALAVFGVALSPSQTVSAASTVVGLWRFNDGSGTTAADSSGLGNNGILAGSSGNLPTWTTGQAGFGGALLFTNDDLNYTYVSIPGSTSLQIGQTATNAWTITAWAYENSDGTGDFAATYGRIMVIDGGAAFQLESGASGDGELYTWSENTTAWQIGWGAGSAVTPLLDQWEHWAVVYDGTNLSVYLNGNEGPNGGAASQAVTAALGFAGYQGAIVIGSELDETPDRNWNGMLDDVAVFNGALTQDEINTVMSGDFSAFLGGPATIISQPQSVKTQAGTTVTFSVGAIGAQPLTYQWYFNNTSLGAGASGSTLAFNSVGPAQVGTYFVVVGNAYNSVTSQPVSLTLYSGNLVGLWRFDEGSGTNAFDSSGLGNTGTLMGESGNFPAWVPSQPGFGSALYFTNDGIYHSYVAVPGNGSLQIGQTATNAWSITAWTYEDSDGSGTFYANYGRILVIDDGTALQLESGAYGDAEFYTWARADAAWQIGWGTDSPVTPLLDQWEHWAVVYDTTNLTIYRDGNQGPNGGVDSQAVNAAIGYANYQGAIHIGTELGQTGDRNWNGMLDDVAVFNIALSPAQVQTVMSGDFSGFLPQPSLSISLGAGNVAVSWPSSASNFILQSAASLNGGVWTAVGTPPFPNGNSLTVTVPASGSSQYFRLVGP